MKNLSLVRTLYNRWISKSPKVGVYVTNAAVILTIIVGMPEYLAMFDIEVPLVFQPHVTKVITICTALLAMIAKLSVKNQTP